MGVQSVSQIPSTFIAFKFDGTQQSIDDLNVALDVSANNDWTATYVSPTQYYTERSGGMYHGNYGLDNYHVFEITYNDTIKVDDYPNQAAFEARWVVA